MKDNVLRKGLVCAIVVLFVGAGVVPSISGNNGINSVINAADNIPNTISRTTIYDGSLSGYVNDTYMNPIEGARVRVYFHGTYEENYSDSSGYYHVTNIPICNCSKNATASKEGYKTEWVLLGITENTTYDFVLMPLSCYPVLNGTQGEGEWFITPVNVTFIYDPEIVAKIYYRVGSEEWTLYTEPFVIYEQGEVVFCWYCVDFEGNPSEECWYVLRIDYTPPAIELTVEKIGFNKWKFTASASDEISGVNRVEFSAYVNWTMGHQNYTFTYYEEPYEWILKLSPALWGLVKIEAKATVYDNAGNSAEDEKSVSHSHSQSQQQSSSSDQSIINILPSSGTKIVKKSSMPTFDGDTLYVGGTGPNNYTNIQDAIDAANPGDTIYVYNGSYHESVSIYKTISLIGEDKNNTIIYPSESSDSVIHISADNSYVSGFRLRNSRTRAGVWIASDNNNIANNIMFNNNKGVYMSGFKNNHISGNIFQNNNFGIYLWPGCTENTFTNNTVFSSVQGGIHVNWNSYDNVFYHNIIFDSVSTSSNNIWDNGYPSGGNYWEGYQGTDGNGDGIGDIPYHVGGGYYDRYPLGFFKPYANFTYTIDDLTVHFNGSMSTDPNPGGYLWAHNWDFGDGTQFNGNQSIISHTYSEYGTYLVSLLVIDNGGETGYVSKLVSTGNRPPDAPSNPDPSDNATEVATNMILSWSGGDPDAGDTVTYDVYFGTTNPPSKVVWNQSGNTYNPGILDLLTTYYWQIVTWDNNNASTTGSIWKFTTCNNPVYEPTNPDPYDGEIEVDLNANLSWTGGGTPGTTVTYDVYFGTTNPPPQVAWDQLETTYNPGPMDYNAHYYWQIVGRDNQGNFTSGLIWDFFTEIATFMSIIPSNIIVETDETFYVDVYIDPCEPITGANFDYLYFDPDILQANSVISHGYFPGAYPPWPYIDNVNGEIRDCYEFIMGPESVSNPGVWVTIEFTAQHQVGTSLLDIEGADCWGSSVGVIVNDGIVNVEAGHNSPPYEPSNPNPYDGEIYVDVDRDLSWTGGDPDPNDILTYDVYFGTSSNPPLVSSGQSSRSYDPGTMNYNTKYYWRIVSWDLFGESTSGPIWDFTTEELINVIVTGLSSGWNLVSLPFNQSVNKTDLIVRYNDSYYSWQEAVADSIILDFIYGWDRSSQIYELTNTLLPGFGYWMWAYVDCDILAQGITGFVTDGYITDLLTGWNLVGLPDDGPVNKYSLMVNYDGTDYNWWEAIDDGIILDFIYGWDRNTQNYEVSDTFDPGYGYWMYAYYDCTLFYPATGMTWEGDKPPYHRDQKHTSNDNGMSNSLWDVTLYFNEPDGSSDHVAFGETSDASDDQDSYDIPRSPPGITSYIHAWFSTDFSDIYGELWEEYKQYPDDYNAWDLSVQWVPSDYSSSTLVTVSWDTDDVDDSEYDSIVLFDVENNVIVADMMVDTEYSFTCQALTLKNFKVICSEENESPDKPTITGLTRGKPGVEYEYSFVSTDPDGDDVKYIVNWGDGTLPIVYGLYASGENATVTHTWPWRGTYTIAAFAEDIYGADSDWGTLEVTMPVNQQTEYSLLQRFLERFPNAFPILRYIPGL